jgi:alpha-tubulin suppressor-like RCC1 family protein
LKLSKKNLIRVGLLALALAAIMTFAVWDAFQDRQALLDRYEDAQTLMRDEKYQEAADAFSSLGEYKDCPLQLRQANYWGRFESASDMLAAGKLDAAKEVFSALANSEDFDGRMEALKELEKIGKLQADVDGSQAIYEEATRLFNRGEYMGAYALFTALASYEDSADKADTCVSALIQKNASTICAGIRGSFAVTEAGGVEYAGEQFADEAEVEGWSDIASISGMGSFILGLKNDGAVISARGTTDYKVDPSQWSDIIMVATGQQFIVGLRADGTVLTQGIDGYGETDADAWTDIASISTGWQHTVGLGTDGDVFDENGNVYIVGYRSNEIAAEIKANASEWTNLKAISTGGSSPGFQGRGHVIGLKGDGTLAAAGDRDDGQCEVTGPEWSNLVAVSAGAYHTVGLKDDGTIVSTLHDEDEIYEQLKDLPDNKIVAVSAGYGFTLVLTEGGDVRGSGNYKQGQIDTNDWSHISHP